MYTGWLLNKTYWINYWISIHTEKDYGALHSTKKDHFLKSIFQTYLTTELPFLP